MDKLKTHYDYGIIFTEFTETNNIADTKSDDKKIIAYVLCKFKKL